MIALGETGASLDVIEWTIRQPIDGAWTARLRTAGLVGGSEGSAVTLDDEAGSIWRGTIVATTELGEQTELELVGGAGQLDAPTVARQYVGGASVASVLADLCGDAGEAPGEAPGSLPAWRSRGRTLRVELDRLARYAGTEGTWRISPGGAVELARVAGSVEPPGELVDVGSGGRTYDVPGPVAPLAGLTLEGWRVATALYARSLRSGPYVTVWRVDRPVLAPEPAVVGGRVTAQSGGRVDVELDDGTTLSELPLWSAAGVAPTIATGVRVLVLDLAGDPRDTIAVSGVDGSVDELDLADPGGRPLRDGDLVTVIGLISGAPTAPVTSPPGLVRIQLDPLVASLPGAPGVGRSKVSL